MFHEFRSFRHIKQAGCLPSNIADLPLDVLNSLPHPLSGGGTHGFDIDLRLLAALCDQFVRPTTDLSQSRLKLGGGGL